MQGSDNKKCANCVELFDHLEHKPLRLPCGHAICESCFDTGYRVESRHQCPRCADIAHEVKKVPDYTISALIASLEVKCSICRIAIATHYCRSHDHFTSPNCRWELLWLNATELDSEEFNLGHYLYDKILVYKVNLKRQLTGSPLLERIANLISHE